MEQLQKTINYKFNNTKLLQRALTHKSFSTENNERLEFLGDSILGAIIAGYLFKKFQGVNEGKLTRMLSSLVKGEALTEIALDINLDKFLKLGRGETKKDNIKNKSTLANGVEALFGAIFIDSDFQTCEKIVLAIYQPRLQTLDPKINFKDNKSNLQELLQQKKLNLPRYNLVKTIGKEHNAIFIVEAELIDYKIKVTSKGKSIKIAEQNCAKMLLERIQEKR